MARVVKSYGKYVFPVCNPSSLLSRKLLDSEVLGLWAYFAKERWRCGVYFDLNHVGAVCCKPLFDCGLQLARLRNVVAVTAISPGKLHGVYSWKIESWDVGDDQIFGERLENVVFVITKDDEQNGQFLLGRISECLNDVLRRTVTLQRDDLAIRAEIALGQDDTAGRWQPIAENSAERAEEGSGFRGR